VAHGRLVAVQRTSALISLMGSSSNGILLEWDPPRIGISSRMAEIATYVYCIVQRSTRPRVARGPSGLGGASAPRLVDVENGFYMVCSDVPLASYGAETIERGLRDLDWVSRVAMAHEGVVERFTKVNGATVIPMKLFTIFSDDDRARGEMRRRRRDLGGIVKRIKGCQEWGVRIMKSARVAAPAGPRALPASGSAFLAEKKRARDAVKEQSQQVARVADQSLRSLSRLAREIRRRDPIEAATSPPALDAAFLVPVLRRAKFKATAAKAARLCVDAGAELTLTGPWPAYHFVQGGDSGR